MTKKGNGVVYKGCEIPHGRFKPSSGETIQVFNHWVISDGTKSKSAYDDGNPAVPFANKDFYKKILPKSTNDPMMRKDIQNFLFYR